MRTNHAPTFVCVEDPHAAQERQKLINRSAAASMVVTLTAICLVAWMDNHYSEKLRDARQAQASTCQAPANR